MAKLTQLEVENFKCLRAINVSFGDNVTEISGPNASGKSSTLDAIATLIIGKTKEPEKVIRTGQRKCRIKGRIGELIVEREIAMTRHGEITRKLRLTRADESYPPTEAQLKDLIGEYMLDPGDFISMKPKDKFEALKVFVPNVDFAKMAREHKADFDRRTDVNRLAKQSRDAGELIKVNPDLPVESTQDEMTLVQKLNDAGAKNLEISKKQSVLIQEREEINRKRLQAQAMQDQIAELQFRRSELLNAALEQEQTVNNWQPIEPMIDTQKLTLEIRQVREVNENVKRAQEREKYLNIARKLEAESEALTKKIEDRKEERRKAIAASDMPLPGLTFGDDEILLNGEPFEQASTAEKMTVGVALACFRNPDLRLIWVRDASLLDDAHRAHLEALSKQFDCQILLETVKPGSADAIVLENGMVKSVRDGEGGASAEATSSEGDDSMDGETEKSL